jgi:aldehyde dehydrogenase (NAD+)
MRLNLDLSWLMTLLCITVSDIIGERSILFILGVDTLPFGGIGNSGMGSYRGKYGFIEFSHAKSVLIRGFVGDGLAR